MMGRLVGGPHRAAKRRKLAPAPPSPPKQHEPVAGLHNPNHFLAVAIQYLLTIARNGVTIPPVEKLWSAVA